MSISKDIKVRHLHAIGIDDKYIVTNTTTAALFKVIENITGESLEGVFTPHVPKLEPFVKDDRGMKLRWKRIKNKKEFLLYSLGFDERIYEYHQSEEGDWYIFTLDGKTTMVKISKDLALFEQLLVDDVFAGRGIKSYTLNKILSALPWAKDHMDKLCFPSVIITRGNIHVSQSVHAYVLHTITQYWQSLKAEAPELFTPIVIDEEHITP